MTRLFHVSDVHFGREDKAAIDWFAARVRDEKPDALVVTGDLTMAAHRSEFEAAAKWLAALGRPTTVGVGNHDLPYFNPWARFVTPYKRYQSLRRMIERPLDVKGVAILPLKTTARFQFRLNWSKGHVSLRALRDTLAMIGAAPRDNTLFVACHHPLVEAGTRMKSETRRGVRTLGALAAAGVQAVLTGHVHDPFDIPHEIGGRTVRLIGAGTLSTRLRDKPPSFNVVTVKDDGSFETVARFLGEGSVKL